MRYCLFHGKTQGQKKERHLPKAVGEEGLDLKSLAPTLGLFKWPFASSPWSCSATGRMGFTSRRRFKCQLQIDTRGLPIKLMMGMESNDLQSWKEKTTRNIFWETQWTLPGNCSEG